jgi:hypothetical protein
MMGFDRTKIPSLANHRAFGDSVWGAFDPSDVSIELDGHVIRGLQNVPVIKRFVPAPGWRGRIELQAGATS